VYLKVLGRPIVFSNTYEATMDLLDKRSLIYSSSGHGQRLPFWVHKRPHSKWYHTLQPSTTTFTLRIVEINGSKWKSHDVLGSRIFIFTLDGAEAEKK
jgi:hypothetical protein